MDHRWSREKSMICLTAWFNVKTRLDKSNPPWASPYAASKENYLNDLSIFSFILPVHVDYDNRIQQSTRENLNNHIHNGSKMTIGKAVKILIFIATIGCLH